MRFLIVLFSFLVLFILSSENDCLLTLYHLELMNEEDYFNNEFNNCVVEIKQL